MIVQMAEADTRQFMNTNKILNAIRYLSDLVQLHSDELVISRMAESIVTETDRITGIIKRLLHPLGPVVN